MADYGHAHRKHKATYQADIDKYGAMCAELVCVMPTRAIPPGTPSNEWDLAHDRRIHTGHHTCTNACYLGPSHPACNRREGGQEKHRKADTRKRWRI